MITADQIRPFRHNNYDYDETVALKKKLAALRQTRTPFYLTKLEFEEILRWKLITQYNRQLAYRKTNTEEIIRSVTELALKITHEDKDYETELRVGILCAIRGVGVPVASAILALVYPEEYGVIDFRCWQQVFDYKKTTFTIPEYIRYLKELRKFKNELGWTVQEVDMAIWAFDKAHNSTRD